MGEERSRRAGPDGLFDLAAVISASDTHVGQVRSVNQDAFGEWRDLDAPAHLLFVADGMGGHRGGEVASQLAVQQVGLAFDDVGPDSQKVLRTAFERANNEIFDTASRDFELAGMGTTGVALMLVGESRGYVAHVGDSRLYRMRDGALEPLTGDHSVVGELVRRGQLTSEEARLHPQSNEILRAIGTQPQVEVEITEIEVRRGDRYLLCSDGLSGMLSDERIAEVLTGSSAEEAVERLIALANEAGGTDNITVQVVDVPETGPASVDVDREESGSVGAEAAAAGSLVRWAVALALVVAIGLFWILGSQSTG